MKGQALAADCTTLSVCLVCSSAIVISAPFGYAHSSKRSFFRLVGRINWMRHIF
jgi:hypothetical protein